MEDPKIYCGIDLGTTNSTVSVIKLEKRSDSFLEKLKSVPIHQYNKKNEYVKTEKVLPSYIYFELDNNKIYTGLYAKEKYSEGYNSLQTVKSVKTRLGGESSVDIPYRKQTKKEVFDMVQCSSLFLKTIRESLKEQMGIHITDVVITVPAAFNNDERQDTINAALLAGFKNIEILDEPTAALLYYINGGEGDLSLSSVTVDDYKLVYDIGGGTLDVTIAKINENEDGDIDIDIIDRSPRMNLGGDNFDEYLAAYFLTEFEKAREKIENKTIEEQSSIIAKLVSNAEEYKIKLNDEIKKYIDDEKRLNKLNIYAEFEITKNMYLPETILNKTIIEEIFSSLIYNNNTFNLIYPIDKCLKDSNLDRNKISEVIITGGMSNFYLVEVVLKKYFGNEIKLTQIDTTVSVSKGAAIHHFSMYNESAKKLEIKDKMSDDIFIKVNNSFEKLIERTKKPGDSGKFYLEIQEEGILDIGVFLYYGIDDDVANYTPLSGKFFKANKKYQKGDKIELEWVITSNKLIQISFLEDNLNIKNDKNLTEDQIKNNAIHNYKINQLF